MVPSCSPFFIFDVHYDGTFNFMPLRYENGIVYHLCVDKDNELDLATVEKEATMASKACDDDISVTSVVDKGKGLADKGKWIKNVNHTFSEDDDSDSDIDIEQRFMGSVELEEMYKGNTNSKSEYSDKSIDYLSEGEDELISLKKRNSEAKKILIKVGEKYVDVGQLKECLTYYSLANGFSLWFYRSLKEQVTARCGLRPEKIKDISKWKQRKGNKYPSVGRDEYSKCPFRCYGKMMVAETSFQ
ncbi:hypothetical protein Tco_0746331, partial [Tanacetum coccineum]